MKIVFLCGSLEPGRDGVGDYSRRLACELIKQGNQAKAVAISEKYLFEELNQIQTSEGVQLQVLRLPSRWSKNKSSGHVKKLIGDFNPDWISLQFVPFSFQEKGLPFNLGKYLQPLIAGRKLHIMFHELWVGMEKEASIKVFLWGKLQKVIIQLLIKKLSPNVLHTQTELYREQLKKIGFRAQKLPLFSNIPKLQLGYDSFKESFDSFKFNKERIVMVFFGSLQKGAPSRDFAKDLAEYSKEEGMTIKVIFIGRNGIEIKSWLEVLATENIEVEVFGEIPPNEISEKLTDANFGISTTPFAQIEKSGTVVAMREHGLNVLVVARPWSPIGIDFIKTPNGISEYRKTKIRASLKIERSNLSMVGVTGVASKLVNSFISKEIN